MGSVRGLALARDSKTNRATASSRAVSLGFASSRSYQCNIAATFRYRRQLYVYRYLAGGLSWGHISLGTFDTPAIHRVEPGCPLMSGERNRFMTPMTGDDFLDAIRDVVDLFFRHRRIQRERYDSRV